MKKYDIFKLTKDLNPIITKGMTGVILEVYGQNDVEVEFVKPDGRTMNMKGKLLSQ